MHSDMPESLQEWETTRRLGRYKYAALFGSLRWGAPMGILMGFLFWRSVYSHQNLVFTVVLWASAGFVVGLVKWMDAEERYLKFQAGRYSVACRPMGPTPIRSPLMRGKRGALR
jgi:hypothetical protein